VLGFSATMDGLGRGAACASHPSVRSGPGTVIAARRLWGFAAREGRRLLVTFTVTNTDDSGLGSLRQAILDASAATGPHTIAFDIPGPGVPTLAPLAPLPWITEPVVIAG
jgi:hypothetical protein